MKSFTLALFAIFAAVALAAPAFEEDQFEVSELELSPEDSFVTYEELKQLGFTDEEIEAYATNFASLIQKLKGKIQSMYNKVCKKNNSDVCKRWAKETITKENVEKLWREIKPLVKAYCSKNKTDALCIAVRIIL